MLPAIARARVTYVKMRLVDHLDMGCRESTSDPRFERLAHDSVLRQEGLATLGVTGHTLEECFDDNRYGHFQGLFITVLASVNLTHTERGDEKFMAMSSRACEAIRDLESLDLP